MLQCSFDQQKWFPHQQQTVFLEQVWRDDRVRDTGLIFQAQENKSMRRSRALPATLEGFQLTRKASRIGFDWEDSAGVVAKMQEETAELETALKGGGQRQIEEEMGDLLFAAVNLARFLDVDPEIALKKANRKFSRRVRAMEARARESGREFKNLSREEMETLWDATKDAEGKAWRRELAKAQARK